MVVNGSDGNVLEVIIDLMDGGVDVLIEVLGLEIMINDLIECLVMFGCYV